MGLEGKLEDLPLIELLQIVAFAKKTGYLRVTGSSGRGVVIVRDGRVLFGCSWRTLERIRVLANDPSKITDAGNRENIASSLRDLTRLEKGSFRFELVTEITDTLGGVAIGPFMVKDGMDPQQLLLDLAVEKDNQERELTSLIDLAFRDDPKPELADAGDGSPARRGSTELRDKLSFRMLEATGAAANGAPETDEDREALVSRMTRRLVEHKDSHDVSALVLEVAARFVERGVLFLVRDGKARGVAGFGFAAVPSECVSASRRIVLDTRPASAWGAELSSGKMCRLRDGLHESAGEILSEIGPGTANEAVLVPMRANGATMLLLYGDNGRIGKPLEGLASLELFVAQAGLALENKLLQRRLEDKDETLLENIV